MQGGGSDCELRETFKVETFRRQTTWLEGNEGEGKPRRLESGAEFAFDAEPGRSEKAWGTKEEAAKCVWGCLPSDPLY